MKKIREIIVYKKEKGLSNRVIARSLSISRDTVQEYLKKFEESGLSYESIKEMTDENFLDALQKREILKSGKNRIEILSRRFPEYSKELKKVGVTLKLLWQEYKKEEIDGFNYSQFCHHYHQWSKSSGESATMFKEHKAGDKTFVDYSGSKMYITDRHIAGLKTPAEIFISILGASGLMYVEASNSQKKEDWIESNCNAFEYYNGVPLAVVPDCLKSGVLTADKYEPDINPEYLDFADHYGCAIVPARPGKPRDKSLVENAVNIVYMRIFAPLRDRIFYTLQELNEAIREKLEELNNGFMPKVNMSRREFFIQTEQSALRPLPGERYEQKKFLSQTVQSNYHIEIREDAHLYSVPYEKIGKKVEIRYNERTVEIFYNNLRIAFHKRDKTRNTRTTLREHRPAHHQFCSEWDHERFLQWAEKIGGHTKKFVEKIIEEQTHPDQSLKILYGVMNLSGKHGETRLNDACAKCIFLKCYSYKRLRNILKNGLENADFGPEVTEEFSAFKLPEHTNIRGENYYRQGGEII